MSARLLTAPFLATPREPMPGTPRRFAAHKGARAPWGGEPGWKRLRAVMGAAWRRYRSRQAIAGLSPFLLKDIGLTHAEAEHEANKPFWRP